MSVEHPRTEWYASATSAALAYHASFFLIGVAQAMRFSPAPLPQLLEHLNAEACLAGAAVAFALRLCADRLLDRKRSRLARPLTDLATFGIIMVVVACIALPLDTSGAALLSLLTLIAVGVPLVLLASVVSVLASGTRWLRSILVILLTGDIIAAGLHLALRLAGM